MLPQGSSRRQKRKCWSRFVSLDLRDARQMPICDWVECGSARETLGYNNQYHQRELPERSIVVQACNPCSSGD